jgi:hypothetical protein
VVVMMIFVDKKNGYDNLAKVCAASALIILFCFAVLGFVSFCR